MLGGSYTLHRTTQARLRNGDMLTPRVKTEKTVKTEGKDAFGERCCHVDFHPRPHIAP